jgi:hypothetical protein
MHAEAPGLPLSAAYAAASAPATARKAGPQIAKAPSSRAGGASLIAKTVVAISVRALRKQGHQDRQIRQRKQPLVRAQTCRFGSARDEAQVAAFRKVANMLDANPRQAGDFGIGEYFLARFYGDHGHTPVPRTILLPKSLLLEFFDAFCILRAA